MADATLLALPHSPGKSVMSILGRQFKMVSPHSAKEISRLLKQSVGWPLFSDRPVVGYFDSSGFQLRVNIWYGNSFQTVLSGSMRWRDGQTEIACRAGLRWMVIVFMAVWFAGVTSFAILFGETLVARILSGDHSLENSIGLLIPPGMMLFGVLLVWFGRTLAGTEEQTLIDFLRDTIDAHET
jgi:hypothetical protein